MKKNFTKFLSLILAFVMIFSCGAIGGINAFAANRAEANIPIIWVAGQGENIFDKDGNKIWDVEEPDGYIGEAVADCIGDLVDAIFLGEIEQYKKKFLSWILPLYEPLSLDKNGENTSGSYIKWDVSTAYINPNSTNCQLSGYVFNNDWRLDPYENADNLKIYIERVKAITGSDVVNLYPRCEGSTIAAAYLDKYGYDDIHKVAYNVPACNGDEDASKLFSNGLKIDTKMGDIYARTFFIVGDDVIGEYFWQMWNALKNIYGLDLTVALANKIIDKVISKVMPEFLLKTFATFPGLWAMVEEDEYELALDTIFYNDAIKEEYSGLIEKIQYYHDHAKANHNNKLLEMVNSNVEVAVFAKYGYATKPLYKDCNVLSDSNVRLCDASFGATAAKWGETLSDSYIAAAEANGTAKYISPDKQVDASTCLLPDTTWIIKGCFHDEFPPCIDNLIVRFFRTPGFNIYSDPQTPQYLVLNKTCSYDINSYIVPMTTENCDTEYLEIPDNAQPIKTNFFSAILAFFRLIKDFIAHLKNGGSLADFDFSLRYK